MVRLKVPHAAIKPIVTVKFQFLDGAIKSRIREQLLQAPQTFQFLDGAIKRSFGVNPDYSFVAFQFLDGAIKSVISIIIKRRVYHVSIP